MARGIDFDLNSDKAVCEQLPSDLLGSGSFANVYEGRFRFPGKQHYEPVAFKVFKGAEVAGLPPQMVQQILAETRSHKKLNHKNMITLYGLVDLQGEIAMVLELARGGALDKVLADRDTHPELPWELRLIWLKEICEGMAELHGNRTGMVHRDLKASNILLDEKLGGKRAPSVKIADFGVAQLQETVAATKGTSAGGMTGTLAFKAPETF
eukprot:COSAG01_NODE_25948_length_728_cov_0.896661_1_plen_209_part_10